jgi:hypothetical protein
LGISDAVEQIGVPDAEAEKTGTFLESIQQNAVAIGASKKDDASRRRRLGRSLKELEDQTS